jgi:hypothetical protein
MLAGLVPGAHAGELSPADAHVARKLYEVKCAKCHEFYPPKAYAQVEWDNWMLKMARKSRLKPDQSRLLTQFLDDYRQRGNGERP